MAKKGTSNTLKKLEARVKDGNYYEALEIYKSLYYRYCAQKKYRQAINLTVSGSKVLLDHKHENSGSELGQLLIDTYTITHMPVNAKSLEPILEIFKHFSETISIAKITFMEKAIKWSATERKTLSPLEGAPELHYELAAAYQADKQFGHAQRHYLRANNATALGAMVLIWSEEGYPSEKDLFLARPIFQYLCLKKVKEAKELHAFFEKEAKPKPTPLLNFVRFVLELVDHGENAAKIFEYLRGQYRPALARDLSFGEYMDHIGQSYFKLRPTSSSGFAGIFGDLIKSMLGGDTEEESDA